MRKRRNAESPSSQGRDATKAKSSVSEKRVEAHFVEVGPKKIERGPQIGDSADYQKEVCCVPWMKKSS